MKTIIINGKEHQTERDEIDYSFLCGFMELPEDAGSVTITYRTRRPNTDEQRSGSLTKDQSTKLENGMVFNVAFM